MNNRFELLLVLSILCIGAAIAGCADACDDVICGPMPIPLEVLVTDTLSVDTTIPVINSLGIIDSVDTILVVRRYITDATVTLRSVSGSDTTTFDTLEPGEKSYVRNNVDDLPGVPFVIMAERAGRLSSPQRAEIRHGSGCCPFTVVGRFDLAVMIK